MSNFLPQHSDLQPPDRDGTPTPAPEPLPDPDGVGRVQRSEPERSDGERSGARPTPSVTPPDGPHSPPSSHPDDDDREPPEPSVTVPNDKGPGPRLSGRRRGRRLISPESSPTPSLNAEQRLLLLDTWQRSGLPAGDFPGLVGVSQFHL